MYVHSFVPVAASFPSTTPNHYLPTIVERSGQIQYTVKSKSRDVSRAFQAGAHAVLLLCGWQLAGHIATVRPGGQR